ncbi:molybdenum cofactor biosynthesis protein MoaE [Candidatus Poribacteria bacterium]|nr:molybdenum cofactor biosynthesis protein MoaE [Candidatus Poribacteria bacterium]
MFKIVESEISIQAVIDAVDTPGAGAIVTFAGIVRNSTRGRRVRYLEFEAYPPMAEKKMKEIADEIYSQWGLDKVAMIHRVGRLEIGEVIVAIAVASPHRDKAFEACQYAIDRLKEVVPIWKREVWEDGTEEWVKPS